MECGYMSSAISLLRNKDEVSAGFLRIPATKANSDCQGIRHSQERIHMPIAQTWPYGRGNPTQTLFDRCVFGCTVG